MRNSDGRKRFSNQIKLTMNTEPCVPVPYTDAKLPVIELIEDLPAGSLFMFCTPNATSVYRLLLNTGDKIRYVNTDTYELFEVEESRHVIVLDPLVVDDLLVVCYPRVREVSLHYNA